VPHGKNGLAKVLKNLDTELKIILKPQNNYAEHLNFNDNAAKSLTFQQPV